MLSRFVASTVVLFVIGGFIVAETFNGVITDATATKLTVKTRAKKGEKGDDKTITINDKTKITKGEDKLSAKDLVELVEKAKEGKGKMKGVFAKITAEDGTASAVEVVQRKGKGKGKAKTDTK